MLYIYIYVCIINYAYAFSFFSLILLLLLAINQLSKQTINIQTQQKQWQPASDIPTGSIVNCEYFNVESPILQIQVSNARNVPNDSSKVKH